MKEPFLALAGVTALVTVSGAASTPEQAERIGALLAAGMCSTLYSWWKSRKRRADKHDTALWAMITLFGSLSFGWVGAPAVANKVVLGIATPGVPLMTWLLAMSAAPILEMLLDGRAFRLLLKKSGVLRDDD